MILHDAPCSPAEDEAATVAAAVATSSCTAPSLPPSRYCLPSISMVGKSLCKCTRRSTPSGGVQSYVGGVPPMSEFVRTRTWGVWAATLRAKLPGPRSKLQYFALPGSFVSKCLFRPGSVIPQTGRFAPWANLKFFNFCSSLRIFRFSEFQYRIPTRLHASESTRAASGS